MRFLVDAQLPPQLAEWLRGRHHQAEHVADALTVRATDRDIVAHARETGAVIVSKDSDFLDLLDAADAPAFVWVRTGNTANPELFASFETGWAQVETKLQAGDRVVEFPSHD